MKKRRLYELLFLGLSLAFAFLSTGGCSRGPAPQNEQQGFIPYILYGSQDGWEISCTARELTAEEKKEKLKELEADWENEKELLLLRMNYLEGEIRDVKMRLSNVEKAYLRLCLYTSEGPNPEFHL